MYMDLVKRFPGVDYAWALDQLGSNKLGFHNTIGLRSLHHQILLQWDVVLLPSYVNLAGRPFVHKKNSLVQELWSAVLPFETNFSDTIPKYTVQIGSESNLFVGFTTILNSSIGYGDYEVVVCHYDSDTMELRGHIIVSTVGKDNYAGIIPQSDNGFVVIGRADGNLTSPANLSTGTQIFAMQFAPLKLKSFISFLPMKVYPNEAIQVQFEYIPSSLGAVVPRVCLNGLNSSSVSWISPDTISAEIPGSISGYGPYELWVIFDSEQYKPSIKIPGIITVSHLPLVSVYPLSGPTVGFNLTLITSYVGIVQGPIAVTVGENRAITHFSSTQQHFSVSSPQELASINWSSFSSVPI